MKCRLTESEIDAVVELFERDGVLERIPDENGEPLWRYEGVKLSKAEAVARGMQITIAGKDKWVLEIRNGVVLFLNEPASAGEEDGWWWGLDGKPIMFGPFESVGAAVKAASELASKPIKVVEHYDVEGEIHYDGFVTINVFDDDGQIWLKADEEPAVRNGRVIH